MITNLRLNADDEPNLIGSIECPIFHRSVDLHLPPTISLASALSSVQQWQDRACTLRDSLAEAVWRYAQAACQQLATQPPSCSNPIDIFGYTSLHAIYLVLNPQALITLLFDLDCSWQVHAGLGWSFLGNDIGFVGSAEDLFHSTEAPTSNYIVTH